jgi:hypothetical protein
MRSRNASDGYYCWTLKILEKSSTDYRRIGRAIVLVGIEEELDRLILGHQRTKDDFRP